MRRLLRRCSPPARAPAALRAKRGRAGLRRFYPRGRVPGPGARMPALPSRSGRILYARSSPAIRSIVFWGYHVPMPDYRAMETKIQQMLGATRRPVAVAFLEAPPAGVTRFTGSEPSSCSFWRLAGDGRVFYTVPSDHVNCPVGSYAHNMVTAERMPELQQALALMSDIGYIRMEEIPGVFQLPVT